MNIDFQMEKLSSKVLDLVFGTANRQRLSILIYHRVLKSEDYMRPDEPTIAVFDWQMGLIAKHCSPLSLAEALRLMDSGKLPDRAVCVTFDDGYADNESLALPILKKWDIPASVFVSTTFLDGGRMWNDTVIEAVRNCKSDYLDLSKMKLGVFSLVDKRSRRKGAYDILHSIKHLPSAARLEAVDCIAASSENLPDDLMLTTDQLKKLYSDGIEIGAHTHSHPILSSLCPEAAREDIANSRNILEKILGDNVRYFAYPNGRLGSDYELKHRDMVCAMGFEAALSTHWGVSCKSTDRWQLARFTPWDNTPYRFLLRLLWNQRNVVVNKQKHVKMKGVRKPRDD